MPHQVAADFSCTVGEGPIWHPDQGRLYWTDIPEGRLFWYEPASGRSQLCYEGRIVGGFTLQADDSLLLFMDKGTVAVWDDGQIVQTIVDTIPAETEQRFNDVTADPEGRVFAGRRRRPCDPRQGPGCTPLTRDSETYGYDIWARNRAEYDI